MSNDEQQVQKDIVQTFGDALQMQTSAALFRERLAEYINALIVSDFEKLVNLLYRLDVSEKKLRTLLTSAANAGVLIADLIVERQLQKLQSRRQFNKPAEDIAEAEKW
ncbi:MAG TPA: hypothetical protein PLP23_02995 [Panacibacter sp.]|nr:hypothetical protein [Panacibacter sp.]